MKKLVVTFALVAAMLICPLSVYADMGIPSTAEFTVAINLDGCAYYKYDDMESDGAAGYFPGGIAFYVYDDYDGYYYGTTESAKDPKNFDKFVYIYASDTVSANENIPPETGEDLGETIESVTTDPLNLRVGPGTGFKIIKTLKKGETVKYTTTIQSEGEWAYVSAGSDNGWVSTKYLDLKKRSKTEALDNENKDNENNDTDADKVDPEEQKPSDETADVGDDESPAKDSKYLVAGIICICVGVALLIAAFAVYMLKRKNRA